MLYFTGDKQAQPDKGITGLKELSEKLNFDFFYYSELLITVGDAQKTRKALESVRKLYIPVYNSFFEAGNMKNRGNIRWVSFYTEGRFATIQCDFIYMISLERERRYVITALREEALFFDYCAYYFNGKTVLEHLEDILVIPEIDVMQCVPGVGQSSTYEWMDLLKKIQKADEDLHLYDWTIENIKHYYKEPQPEGPMFDIKINSP